MWYVHTYTHSIIHVIHMVAVHDYVQLQIFFCSFIIYNFQVCHYNYNNLDDNYFKSSILSRALFFLGVFILVSYCHNNILRWIQALFNTQFNVGESQAQPDQEQASPS